MINIINKIIVWGDSVLKGISLDNKSGRYSVLPDNSVSLFSEESGYNIKNRSKFGCTITKGHTIMEKDLEKEDVPQYAIIEFGGNDCDFNWKEISENPDVEHYPKTELKPFLNEMQSMIDEARGKGIEPIIATLPPLEPNKFFKTVSKGLDACNILKWLGDVYAIYRWQEKYSNAITILANKNNCKILDIRGAFLNERQYSKYICEDGMHPNELGHKLMADSFAKCFSI